MAAERVVWVEVRAWVVERSRKSAGRRCVGAMVGAMVWAVVVLKRAGMCVLYAGASGYVYMRLDSATRKGKRERDLYYTRSFFF